VDRVKIRPARERDLPAILELFGRLNEAQSAWRVFAPRADIASEMETRYRSALANPDALLVVASEGDEVVGMTLGQLHRPSSYSDEWAVELSSAIVKASHRNRGIGGALAAEIGRFARERGVERVTLKTFVHNEEALRLWASLGFEPRILQMTAPADRL
jgi:ribosomal protein S18 acetylase RimI-like enzyme